MNRILSTICLSLFTLLAYGQSLNEIMYDPVGDDGGGTPGEWVELFGPAGADIGCYVLTDGDFTITIPSGTTIPSDGFFVIGRAGNANSGNPAVGISVDLDVASCGCTSGSSPMVLTNSGEYIGLFDDTGAFVEGVIWESPSSGNQPSSETTFNTAGLSGCPSSVDIGSNAGSFVSVGSGNNNSIAKDFDGSGTWEYRAAANGTPGETNVFPLPVTLISFDAKAMNQQEVMINWGTASEENNNFFVVEHSTNGREFTPIAQLYGAGTTFETQAYEYLHRHARVGQNYYRLQQVDFDGTTTYSPVVAVNINSGVATASIRPTVATEQVTLIAEASNTSGTVLLLNLQGQLLRQLPFAAGQQSMDIPVVDLAPGQYLLRLQNGDESQVLRFVKVQF